ncbi:HxsD-like protein [Patescibacteria group bacterium]|nr:HxsD-like protein [Patescibacteria group bacterium]
MLIQFNKKIYPKSVIKRAIKDYSGLADFTLEQNENYFLVEITNAPFELKNVFEDEFSNYILSLMKK